MWLTTLTAIAVLLIYLNVSEHVLSFFSIDIPVFKVVGGLLLFNTSLSMIKGQATKLEEREEQGDSWFQISKQRFRKVIVPMVVPMLAVPGSITTVILYGSRAEGLMDYVSVSIVLIFTMFLLFVIFAYSHYTEKSTDELVFTVFTSIPSILVSAIAIQFVLEGLGEVFPNWMEGDYSTFENRDSASNGGRGSSAESRRGK
ncbi:MAG: MarC family protein [Cyclobacteriaceae bacterium]